MRIIERAAQLEAIDGALAIDKSELKTLATPFYFTHVRADAERLSSGAPGTWLRSNSEAKTGVACTKLLGCLSFEHK